MPYLASDEMIAIERDEQKVLLESLGRVAANRRLGTEPEQVEDRRRRIVEILLEHAEAFPEIRTSLKALARSTHVPAELKARIVGDTA